MRCHAGNAVHRDSEIDVLSLRDKADYNAERSLRTEYLTAVGQFISQAGTIMEGMPAAAPYLLKMIAWVTAAFRGSSDIETVLDEAIQMASKPPEQPANQPPPGAEAMASEGARAQADQASAQAKTASAQAINQSRVETAAKTSLIKVAEAKSMPKKE